MSVRSSFLLHVIAVFGMQSVGGNWPLFEMLECQPCVKWIQQPESGSGKLLYLDPFSIKQLFLMHSLYKNVLGIDSFTIHWLRAHSRLLLHCSLMDSPDL